VGLHRLDELVDESGSWKIMAMSPPRISRISSSPRSSRFTPSNMTSPEILVRGPRVSPMTVRLETDLPDPDSPTMPSVRPRSTW
jgi:hypothetical protein